MKVIIPADALTTISKLVKSVAPSKPALAIIKGALLSVANGELRVEATDMQTSMVIQMPVEGQAGSVVIAADKLAQLAAIGSGPVQLAREAGSDFLTFRTNGRRGKIPAYSRAGWPGVADHALESFEGFKVNSSVFSDRLGRVEWAQGEENRAYLHGVFIWGDGSTAFLRTGNGHAIATAAVNADCAPFDGVLVAAPTVQVWKKMLGHVEGDIIVRATDRVSVQSTQPTGGAELTVTVSSQPVEASFPNAAMQQMVEFERNAVIEADRDELIKLVADARKVVENVKDGPKVKSTSIRLTPAPGSVSLRIRDNQGGEFSGAVDADVPEDASEHLGYNDGDLGIQSAYLLKSIESMAGSRVRLSAAAKGSIAVEGVLAGRVTVVAHSVIMQSRVPW